VSEKKDSSPFAAAIGGGIIGAAITALLLVLVVPQYLGSRIVRQGMLADPQILPDAVDALQDAQYAPILAEMRSGLETPFGTSWKGAAKPDVTLVEFYDYACPYCKAINPAVDRLLKEDRGLRVVYRELPVLGPESVAAARLSLAASKSGRFARFHDTLWAAGRPAPETIAAASQAAGIAPTPPDDPAIEAELRRNFQMWSALGGKGTPAFVIGNRVILAAVPYETLKEAIAHAREQR